MKDRPGQRDEIKRKEDSEERRGSKRSSVPVNSDCESSERKKAQKLFSHKLSVPPFVSGIFQGQTGVSQGQTR